MAHFDFHVARTAMAQGFYPDIISTDLTLRNSLRTDKVYSLLHVMSKYLNMGMSFFDIVRAVTATPARLMKMQGQIGTWRPALLLIFLLLSCEKRTSFLKIPTGSNSKVTVISITALPYATVKLSTAACVSNH